MESVTKVASSAWSSAWSYVPSLVWDKSPSSVAAPTCQKVAAMSTQTSNGGGWMRPRGGTPLVGSPFLRLAGVSGALAVAMGAYGAHAFSADRPDLKKVYDTANFHHFVHTLALLAVPLCRRPALTGTLMIAGTSLFCGTIYYHALTEQKTFRKYTPYGGIILIMAWLSMAL